MASHLARSNRQFLLRAALAVLLALGGAAEANSSPGPEEPVLIIFTGPPGETMQALDQAAGVEIKYTYHIVPAIAAFVPPAALNGLARTPGSCGLNPMWRFTL